MSAKRIRNIALLTMTATSGLILPGIGVEAREPERPEAARPPTAHAAAAEHAGQSQERQAQAQAVRAEQEQANRQHSDEMRQAVAGRQQQEEVLRAQEQQGRKAQQEAMKEQQQQARAQQEQARGQEQTRGQQRTAMMEHGAQPGGAPREHSAPPGAFVIDRQGNPVTSRAATPPPLTAERMPLQKAMAMPVLEPNASAGDRQHLQEVQNNLQAHIYAVPAADAPSNYHNLGNLARQAYLNNYQANVANQMLTINRQNTFISALDQNQWPAWYQPQPNWQFCNGFTLGNAIVCDLNWLRWGWHPYYGPQPQGFVCARNYMPTPWIYLPAYGTWRQPGVNSYASYGPPFDYTGPISVEVFEPRHITFDEPFGGLLPQRVINAVYFYNAFYYPDFGRYGYMNRHGNWIWLNLGAQPF